MDVFPMQNQITDRSLDIRLRDFSPDKLLVQLVFRIFPAVYAHQIRHIGMVGNHALRVFRPLAIKQFFHIPPCTVYAPGYFLTDKRIAISLDDAAEIPLRTEDLHAFMLLHKLPHLRILKTGVHVDSRHPRVSLPHHVKKHAAVLPSTECHIGSVLPITVHPFPYSVFRHPYLCRQRKGLHLVQVPYRMFIHSRPLSFH